MVDYKNTFLKCQTSLVVKTTSLELENFIKEVTGFHFPVLGRLKDGSETDSQYEINGHLDENYDTKNKWNHFKETGDYDIYFTVEDVLNGLTSDGMINCGIYIIKVVDHINSTQDLLTSDAKDVLHGACIDVCNAIRHTKHSNLHMDMVSAVWDAANKVLRAHTKNS